MKLYYGDCFEESKKIQEESVDLILTDPPYGVLSTKRNVARGVHYWDEALDPEELFAMCNRLLRKNGKLILFSQEPYTSKLITQAIPNLPFCYRLTWKKNSFASPLGAKKNPLSVLEDILVFSKENPVHDFGFTHPLRSYFSDVFDYIGLSRKKIIEQVGQGADHVFRFSSSQFAICTRAVYEKLLETYSLEDLDICKSYDELSEIDAPYRSGLVDKTRQAYPSIFNLRNGEKYKSNLLEYPKEAKSHHPTQKPTALLIDLIETYSNTGNTVLDFTMGSGSTGVACASTGRNFIGIERDVDFYMIAQDRIDKALDI